MKLAYSANAYMRFPIDEAIRRVAALGYHGIELMADAPHAWPADTSDAQITQIRRWLGEAGLTISNVNAFMMNKIGDPRQPYWHPSWIEADPEYRAVRAEHTVRALTMAKKLGAPSITTEPGGPLEGDMEWERGLDIFVKGLKAALRHAEREGVMLLVEPEPGLLIENPWQFEQLAERIDSPAFGLNFDIGHFYCVDAPLPQTVQRLAKWTRHYHLEDIAASRVHQHLVPGTGAIDFKSTLDAIRTSGYEGWITVELYPFLEDPDAAGRAALAHLSPLIAV
ncbi:MAG TPA: sugar phosphate isomerase/epimerase family protein [Phycisphaerae bacterium]|jgi:sugar phosphate isomerase/epimerase